MTANWKLLTDEMACQVWDADLARFADCTPFQSYLFGQYSRRVGWQPFYWVANDEHDQTAAMCLGLLRQYPLGVGMVWCVGGPIGDVKAWDVRLRNAILETTGIKHLYIRFRCDRERNVSDALCLAHHGWTRSISQIASNFSLEIDLSLDDEALTSNMDGRWRRNLRLALQNDLRVERCTNPDVDELVTAFTEMESRKDLPPQFTTEKLRNLFQDAVPNLIFFRCTDNDGDLLSFRACLTAGSRAVDYFAVTTQKGRTCRASYVVLWEMLLHCRNLGLRFYDLGGIDPWTNPGTYTFKKQTGAREVEYLGEWDWASYSLMRLLGNWAIRRRKARRSCAAADRSQLNGSGTLIQPAPKMP